MHAVFLGLCCLISGTVHAPSGAPIAQANVTLRGASPIVVVSDPSGHFRAMVHAGSYSVDAVARGYAGVTIAAMRVDHDTSVDIVLEPLDSPKLRTIGSVTVDGRLARISGVIPSVDVSRASLDRLGENRVVQALVQIPSLDVQYPHNASSDGLATVSLRGPDPSETMVTLDGQLLNDANTGDLDVSQLPSAAFTSISVTEGLGPQDLEGSSTIGGAVNLVALRPTRDPHSALSLSTGSFGQNEIWYNATGSAKKLGYAFAVDDRQAQGYVDETDDVCPISGSGPCEPQHLGSWDSQRAALGNLDYAFSQNSGIGLRVFSMSDARDQSAAIAGYQNVAGGTISGPGPQTFSQSIRAYQFHEHSPLGAGELIASASIADNNVDLAGGGVGNPFYDLSHQDKRGTESLTWQRTFEQSDFSFGGLLRQESFVALGAVPQLSQSIASYFVRAGIKPSPKLHLSAGAFESRYSTFGSNLDGRIGAIYEPDPSTSVRFSAGTGFRAPLLIERYVFPLDQLPPPDNNCVQAGQGNPNERPEHATEYEIGVSHTLRTQATFDVSLYRTNLRDPIENFYPANTQNPGCATTYTSYPINVGNAVYEGAEIRYAQRLTPKLFLSAMYGLNVAYPLNMPAVTVANPTSGSTLVNGRQFENIPQQQASLELEYTGGPWHAGAANAFRGPNNPLNQGPFVLTDVSIGKELAGGLDLTVAATNVFNAAAGKFQVFGGGTPYRGIIDTNGTLGDIPTNLLTIEPAAVRVILTKRF
ncbi:MAG TPA: TonB-dependent receptor [Candidatus Baltobacteraceae bacterium]|jgi:outer membrane cobalamin receptor|nr:TonB-dependent receptor [Candidatus Baltobacteraceae bacterium]